MYLVAVNFHSLNNQGEGQGQAQVQAQTEGQAQDAFGRVPRVGARETDGMSVEYYEKVGRDGDEAKRAFELWTRTTNADFRSAKGASCEEIRTSVVSTALAR